VNLPLDTLYKIKVKYWELAALLCLYSSSLKHVRPHINCMVLCERGVIVSVQSPMDITSFNKTVSKHILAVSVWDRWRRWVFYHSFTVKQAEFLPQMGRTVSSI